MGDGRADTTKGNSMSNDGTQGSASAAVPEAAPKGTELEATLLLSGAKAVFPPGSIIMLNGQSMTQAQLVSALEVMVARFTAVADQQRLLDQTRAVREAELPGMKQTLFGLKLALRAFFGPRNPELASFGIHEKKQPPEVTPEQRALRAAKAKLTRAARRAMGGMK